jgi:hypothetical protein
MKNLLFSLVIGSVLASALFFGCDFSTPPEVQKTKTSKKADSTDSTDSLDAERKDVLALKHLQITTLSEDMLASYVMDFINGPSESGSGRSVQPAPAVVITKITKITHIVETGFAETTADKRSARSVIGPDEIPFYVFTLGNQQTGETGFALTCGDSRIGAVLAIVEKGEYDEADNPFLAIFYTGLNIYIENTISVYNSITQADIENVLNKTEAARAAAPNLPVTDVGKHGSFIINKKDDTLLPVKWNQGSSSIDMYNQIIMKWRCSDPVHSYIVAGCGPVAIAQIMAYHKMPRYSNASKYKYSGYDWSKMTAESPDAVAQEAIGVLLYEIGLPNNANAEYEMRLKTEGGAETGTFNSGVIKSFRNMGYTVHGSFITYNLKKVQTSIDDGKPVMVGGCEKKVETKILGIFTQTSYEEGHYWVIDGYAQMTTDIKDKFTGVVREDPYPSDFVHCNMGWGGSKNGWYISGVFNANDIPIPGDIIQKVARSEKGEEYYFRYKVEMLTGITPK